MCGESLPAPSSAVLSPELCQQLHTTRWAILVVALLFALVALLSLGVFIYQGARSEPIGVTFGSTRLAFLLLLGQLLRAAAFAASALSLWRYAQAIQMALNGVQVDWEGVIAVQKRAWVTFAVLMVVLAIHWTGSIYVAYEWAIADWTDSGRYE